MDLKLTSDEVTDFLAEVFPQIASNFSVEHMEQGEVHVRMHVTQSHLRPGNTVSGPSMFALADVAFYIALLAHIGREALTVTTNCSIDFMRKPSMNDMIGKARILKLGRSLAVGDVLLYSDGEPDVKARASLTYAIPPKKIGV